MSLIDNILNVFIFSRERTIRLADLQLQLKSTTTPIDIIELNKFLLNQKSLFQFTYVTFDLAVAINILSKACPSYNSPSGCSLSSLNCDHLHVCEKQLRSVNGCRGTCRLNHSLDSAEIRHKITKERFDHNILMQFFQTFYAPNTSEREHISDDDSAINETNFPIEQRSVTVRFSDVFVERYNQNHLFNVFARRDTTGGGFIENLIYKPNELHAIITYQKKSTADRLIKQRVIRCDDGVVFTVARMDEQKSSSDYIPSSSRSKNKK